MSKTELAPGISVYHNVFADYKDLPSMIEDSVELKAMSWLEASVSGGNNKEVRDTDTIVVSSIKSKTPPASPGDFFQQNMLDIIETIFKPSVTQYMADHGVFFEDYETYSILKYGAGQKFINHIDDHPKHHRRVSMVYYMNEDYEGGEIEFPRFNIKYKPKANDLILFPSGYTYNHSVHPVVSGTRYAIVGWIK